MRKLRAMDRARRAATVLQEGALRLDRFEDCFTSVAELFDARTFHLVSIGPEGQQKFLGPEPTLEILDAYNAGAWEERDAWSTRAKRATRSGLIVTDTHLISEDLRRTDPFFQEFGRALDLQHYAAWTFRIEDQTYGFTFIRPGGLGYSEEEVSALQSMRPAAESAALLASSKRRAMHTGFALGLEACGLPSIVLNHQGRVSFMTTSAQRYVGSAFTLKAGFLSGLDSATDAHFARLRAWAIGRKAPFPDAFRMTSPGLRADLSAHCIPVASDSLADLPGAAVILSIVDRSIRPRKDLSVLANLYGLTKRECDLASLLAAGSTPGDASHQLGLKITTVRQMLKSVMTKMHVHRQTDLVALLIRYSVQSV